MLRAIWIPCANPQPEGLGKEIGNFYVGWEQDSKRGEIGITLKVPANPNEHPLLFLYDHYFASLHIHYDGIEIVSELERTGFLRQFEQIKANTFYDVMQCFSVAGIPVMVHGDNEHEFVNREMYRLLTEGKETV